MKEGKESLPTCSTISGGDPTGCFSANFQSLYHDRTESPFLSRLARDHSVVDVLSSQGFAFRIGTYWCRVQSQAAELLEPLSSLYREFDLHSGLPAGIVADIDIEINKTKKVLWAEPEVEFRWRGYPPLPTLPFGQVHPLFEWGLNWSMATLLGTEIVIHAAILERGGKAITLPGEPGAGKSTLCAALALSGWRLLSDELTVIESQTGLAIPLPRPISLKDKAIEVIAQRYPLAQMTVPVRETRKGSISYIRPPSVSVRDALVKVPISTIVFPQYQANSSLSVGAITAAASLARLMAGTFNVGLLGHEGFSSLASVVGSARSYTLQYGDLDAALDWIEAHCP